jgi:hypothetical protein
VALNNSTTKRRLLLAGICFTAIGQSHVSGAEIAAPATDDLAPITIVLPKDSSQLKMGPNVLLVRETCTECHSANYFTSQPPLDRATWQAIIQKMAKKFEMDEPSPKNNEAILEYLVTNYGQP